MPGALDDLSSYAVSVVRLGTGLRKAPGPLGEPLTPAAPPEGAATATWGSPTDPERLVLYEFEACPYCRKAREALSHLDLDVEVRPVGKGSPRRAELKERGGKVMVPFLIDPRTELGARGMYESEDILRYLYATYGNGHPPTLARLGPLNTTISFWASAVRPTRGLRARVRRPTGEAPARLVELYSMESSPYCRKVREALVELDLPYYLRNVPRGSPERAALAERGGKVQVPFLVDPNTEEGAAGLYESDDIVAYLGRTYGG